MSRICARRSLRSVAGLLQDCNSVSNQRLVRRSCCNAVASRALRLSNGSRCKALTQTLLLIPSPGSIRRSYNTFDSNDVNGAVQSTIYALSTAPGTAAIAIIRISGPACLTIYRRLCPSKPDPRPRHVNIRTLKNPKDDAEILDPSSVVLYFRSPGTLTGEDILELHTHGGPAIVRGVLAAISHCSTASLPIKYAEPGEFTKRAFLNDRLSLPQVEALGDTLSAVTEEQRRIAVAGTQSGLSARYELWRSMLLAARGELEALIDFSEDQHFDESPRELASNVAAQVRHLLKLITLQSSNAMRGELLRNGISLSLIGSPNVGKSSLLNCIVGRDAAIVSREAGTTRDIVEVGIDIGGFFCRLGDTAGLRQLQRSEASLQDSAGRPSQQAEQILKDVVGDIEAEGIKRARSRAEASDLIVLVLSIEPSVGGVGVQLQIDPDVVATAKELMLQQKNMLVVVNKMDRYSSSASASTSSGDSSAMDSSIRQSLLEILPNLAVNDMFFVSCLDAKTNSTSSVSTSNIDPGNIQSLLRGLTQKFRVMTTPITAPADSTTGNDTGSDLNDASMWTESLGATERHRVLLDECALNLQSFLSQVEEEHRHDDTTLPAHSTADDGELDIVLAAESLRRAADCLARITGRNADAGDVEDVLGIVFEK